MDVWEVVRVTRCLHRGENRQNRVEISSERRERVGTTVERTLAGDAGEKHARTESLRESERVR